MIDSTYLPTLLRTAGAAGRQDGIEPGVNAMQWLSLGLFVTLGAAQVLSPIGLGQAISPAGVVNATFSYAADPSMFKQATFSRDDYGLSRSCAGGLKPCPGNALVSSHNISGYQVYPTALPPNITECFESGVSSLGDIRTSKQEIEFSRYQKQSEPVGNLTYRNDTGVFQYINQVVLDPGNSVKEGIVIDSIRGGIGFRNHTVPTSPRMAYGATWTEDLLWVIPVSQCVGTNWTVYSKPQLAPFAAYEQASIQYPYTLTYEDHGEKYGIPPPQSHGRFRFDERLQSGADALTHEIIKAFNLSKQSRPWNLTSDVIESTTNLESMIAFGQQLGFTFYAPLDAFFAVIAIAPKANQRRGVALQPRQTSSQEPTATPPSDACYESCSSQFNNCLNTTCHFSPVDPGPLRSDVLSWASESSGHEEAATRRQWQI